MPHDNNTAILALGFLALLAFFFASKGLVAQPQATATPALHGWHLIRDSDGRLVHIWVAGPMPLSVLPAAQQAALVPAPHLEPALR